MRSPLCACAHSRVTDASCAILHRPAVAVETPSQSHTARHRRKVIPPAPGAFPKKTSPLKKDSLESNQSENSGANPVSARVFGAARDVGDRQPLPPFTCSDPKPTNIISGSHHSVAVSEFHKDRIPSTAD